MKTWNFIKYDHYDFAGGKKDADSLFFETVAMRITALMGRLFGVNVR